MTFLSIPKAVLSKTVAGFFRFSRPLAYVEIGLFLVLCYQVQQLWFPSMPAFYTVQPHPYLFGVLFVAACYGLREGVAVAAMTAAVWAVQLRMQVHAGWEGVLTDPLFWKNGALLCIAGPVGGWLRDLHTGRVTSLEDRLRTIRDVLVDLQVRHDQLSRQHVTLQRRAVEQTASVEAASKAPAFLVSLDRVSLHKELLEAVGRIVGAERCSVLVSIDNGRLLRLVETRGWEAASHLVIDPADVDVVHCAIRERRIATFADARGEGQDDIGLPWGPYVSLMCAPLYVRDRLYGVVNIELLSFRELSEGTVRSLDMIARMAESALENIERFEAAVHAQTGDAQTGLATYDEAVAKLHAECRRMHRYRTHMSAMVVKWCGELDALRVEESSGQAAWPAVGSLLGRQMRSVDVVAHDRAPGQFLVLMPLTDLRHALVAAHRLHRSLIKQSQPAPDREGDWSICVGSIRREETPEAFHTRLHREIEKSRARGPIGVAG